MDGSEKQIAWANDIMAPVRDLIAQLPDDMRERYQYEEDLATLVRADRIIACRGSIADWCEGTQEWIDVHVTHSVSEDDAMHNGTPYAFRRPACVSAVVF